MLQLCFGLEPCRARVSIETLHVQKTLWQLLVSNLVVEERKHADLTEQHSNIDQDIKISCAPDFWD